MDYGHFFQIVHAGERCWTAPQYEADRASLYVSCTAFHAKPGLRISQMSPDVFLHSCANGANGVVACGLRYLVKPHGSEYIGLRGQGFRGGGTINMVFQEEHEIMKGTNLLLHRDSKPFKRQTGHSSLVFIGPLFALMLLWGCMYALSVTHPYESYNL